MSGLLDVLSAQGEAICRALAEKLGRAGCPTLAQTRSGGCEAFFETLRACCGDDKRAAARHWAKALRAEASPAAVPFAEVLAALHCLEWVVRYYVVKAESQKKALLSALAELSEAVDLLRCCCADCLSAEQPAGDQQIEQTLAESEARKHAILESSLDPIVTIDDQGVITEFNRAAEQIFGHPREKVLGTKPSEVLFPADKSAGHQNRIDRYLDAGEGSMLGKRIEVTAVRADGETFPAEMAMTISQEHGAPVLTFFVRDISRRKKAEREQARYATELERSNRELEQFAYVASHDLQEPLRKIQTFSNRLEAKCGQQLDDTGRECVRRMHSAAGRMQLLIEGLLTLSRVTTRPMNFAPVDLAQVAGEVVADLEVPIEQAGGRVEVGKLPTIQADPLQMRQLLQNLIANAIRFRRTDEPPLVKVHGRFVKGRRQRRVGQPAEDEQCRILVEDNGIGFDEKHLDRIFSVFQRLHPRDVYEGTGVGLAICRRIVQRHGGSITARSTPGHGATFEVLLPAVHQKREKR